MEMGHVVRFASQQHPFLVETAPCLNLDCCCSIMGLTLRELVPPSSEPDDRLTFTLRVCLKNWIEHDPPPRSLEVESLVREFMARFPPERIGELAQEFEQARVKAGRLCSLTLTGSADQLVTYSEVIDEGGGIREGVFQHSFFFVFEGREFLVEDHYCANPQCDCQEVHLEFWERDYEFSPERRLKIRQRLMTLFTLAGKLKEIRSCDESTSTTKSLVSAWLRRCGEQFEEFRRRYALLKKIGARSFPSQPVTTTRVDSSQERLSFNRSLQRDSRQQARRNDPCPCGSGLKFKRCCARRSSVVD
jgi:hypothetical protein